jgi:hypothetical protein
VSRGRLRSPAAGEAPLEIAVPAGSEDLLGALVDLWPGYLAYFVSFAKRLTPTLGIYVVTIVVGLFVPILAVVGYLVLALFILVPFSLLRRGAATRTPRSRRPWRRP